MNIVMGVYVAYVYPKVVELLNLETILIENRLTQRPLDRKAAYPALHELAGITLQGRKFRRFLQRLKFPPSRPLMAHVPSRLDLQRRRHLLQPLRRHSQQAKRRWRSPLDLRVSNRPSLSVRTTS